MGYNGTNGSPSGSYSLKSVAFLSVGGEGFNGQATIDLTNGNNVIGLIQYAMDAKLVPRDNSGIYIVVPNAAAPNIQVPGDFCGTVCSYHGTANLSNVTGSFKWGLVPSQSSAAPVNRNCRFCVNELAIFKTPSGDPSVDSIAVALARTLLAVISNPSGLNSPFISTAWANSELDPANSLPSPQDYAKGRACLGRFTNQFSPSLLSFM